MKRSFSNTHLFPFIFSIIFILIINSMAAEPTAGKMADIMGDSVNLRVAPNVKSKVLGQLNGGDRVKILQVSTLKLTLAGETHPWIQVQTEGASKINGWIYGKYVAQTGSFLRRVLSGENIAVKNIPERCNPNSFSTLEALENSRLEERYTCTFYKHNDEEWNHLNKFAFYLKEYNNSVSHIRTDDMSDAYDRNSYIYKPVPYYTYAPDSYNMVPLFFSADYLLHVYHLIFQRMLENAEMERFHPALKEMTDLALRSLVKRYQESQNPEMKNAFKKAAAYFAVPAAIFGIPIPDKEIENLSKSDVESVSKASGKTKSDITGIEDDFSMYLPRGHYDKNETLKEYFKAMTWFGRNYFPLENILPALAIADALSAPEIESRWEKIYRPTAMLVGESDDLDYLLFRSAVIHVFGKSFHFEKIPDEKKIKKLIAFIDEKSKERIISASTTGMASTEKEVFKKLRGFRVMGQRFILDSYFFTQLTSPRVGNDTTPRNMPKGLDVMAILGSREADEELSSEKKNIDSYDKNLQLLKKETEELFRKGKIDTVYTSWLYVLSSLFSTQEKKLPAFTKTKEWKYRELLAAHGSWAELKHDTILYGKQSMSEMGSADEEVFFAGAPWIPKGYVEPNPIFFHRLKQLVEKTQSVMKKYNMLTDEYEQKFSRFLEVVIKFHAIAESEVENQTISDEDFLYIGNINGTLNSILLPYNTSIFEQDELQMALIADIHTDSLNGSYLEVGVGLPRMMHVLVKDANGERICRGYTFSYYEFASNERMTDKDWKKEVYLKGSTEKLRNKEPSWTKKIPFVME